MLDVLTTQATDVEVRIVTARAEVVAHEQRRDELLAQLIEHDGELWHEVRDWRMRSRSRTLEAHVTRLGDVLLALRATIDDEPLGFRGLGNSTVSTAGLGTLSGAAGLPPLVEPTILSGDPAEQDRGPGADQLVDELRNELSQTPED